MKSKRVVLIGVAAALGCGGPESSSSFTSCSQSQTCRTQTCTVVEQCQVDECHAELDYEFAGQEYNAMCTFGPTVTTTVYPPDGGSGTTRIESNLQECFYKSEVQFNDFDEETRCTNVQECTVQELACNPSTNGQPNCSVVGQTAC